MHSTAGALKAPRELGRVMTGGNGCRMLSMQTSNGARSFCAAPNSACGHVSKALRVIGRPAPLLAQLYHTYRPMGRGASVITTSEPDTRRVPDINAAYAGLARCVAYSIHSNPSGKEQTRVVLLCVKNRRTGGIDEDVLPDLNPAARQAGVGQGTPRVGERPDRAHGGPQQRPVSLDK